MKRWLYHVTLDRDGYAPASLATEGFVHCSYAEMLHESLALYFDADVEIWQLDPTLVGEIDVAATPRGPMPHVLGVIPRAAIVARWSRATLPASLP